MDIGISILMVPYNNEGKALVRLERDIVPTIAAHPNCRFELVVVDNSERLSFKLMSALDKLSCPAKYHWSCGANLQYSKAANIGIQWAAQPYLLYMCSAHGHMLDPTWLDDIFKPLLDEPKVGKTGTVAWSPFPNQYGIKNTGQPQHHIQGGVFASRTALLQQFPYDDKWPHYGADIQQDYRLMEAGYVMKDVPTIKSIWRKRLPKNHGYKFIHDSSEG